MKKNTTKKVAAKKNKQPVVFQTGTDLKSALLVVSLLINAFVFCVWLTLQITSQYDQALYQFFVLR
jgi:hypothetical protein